MSEHRRPNGMLARGYYCTHCGKPGVNMYASGHRVGGKWVCQPNPELVKRLDEANRGDRR